MTEYRERRELDGLFNRNVCRVIKGKNVELFLAWGESGEGGGGGEASNSFSGTGQPSILPTRLPLCLA